MTSKPSGSWKLAVLFVLIGAVLVVALAACGGGGDNDSPLVVPTPIPQVELQYPTPEHHEGEWTPPIAPKDTSNKIDGTFNGTDPNVGAGAPGVTTLNGVPVIPAAGEGIVPNVGGVIGDGNVGGCDPNLPVSHENCAVPHTVTPQAEWAQSLEGQAGDTCVPNLPVSDTNCNGALD